jgi:hypothetical protein
VDLAIDFVIDVTWLENVGGSKLGKAQGSSGSEFSERGCRR